jgi:hypothetical protein
MTATAVKPKILSRWTVRVARVLDIWRRLEEFSDENEGKGGRSGIEGARGDRR